MQAPRDRLAELWVAHKPTVEAFVRARVEPGQVDDIVVQTFTVAWQRLDDVPAEALPWLLVVARNLLLHAGRTTRRQAALAVRARPLVQDEPGADCSALARVGLVRAWELLTDQQRETLALVAWDGLSPAQAGQVCGISRVAFSVRLLRARRRLEALMVEQEAVTDAVATLQPGREPTQRALSDPGLDIASRAQPASGNPTASPAQAAAGMPRTPRPVRPAGRLPAPILQTQGSQS